MQAAPKSSEASGCAACASLEVRCAVNEAFPSMDWAEQSPLKLRRCAQVIGQTADLYDLQRILLRSANKLGDAAQQNMTRWAVFTAASLLRKHATEHK